MRLLTFATYLWYCEGSIGWTRLFSGKSLVFRGLKGEGKGEGEKGWIRLFSGKSLVLFSQRVKMPNIPLVVGIEGLLATIWVMQ